MLEPDFSLGVVKLCFWGTAFFCPKWFKWEKQHSNAVLVHPIIISLSAMFSCNKNGLAFYMVSFWFLRVFSDGEAVRFSAWITHLKYNDVQSICVPNIATDSIFACNIRSSLNRIRVSAFGHISIIVTAFGSDSWHCYCWGCDSTSWLNRKGFFFRFWIAYFILPMCS